MTKWSEASKASCRAKHHQRLGIMPERVKLVSAMYREGYTLQQIGDQFGVTRERIRQLLRKFTDIQASDGGRSEQTRRRQAKLDATFLAKHGCSRSHYRELLALGRKMVEQGISVYSTPCRAYNRQRNNARIRGIEWHLNLWQWWTIWQQSGKWERRGRGQGYVMCRHGDVGPYAIGNVFIATARENSSRPDAKKSGLPMGVVKARNRFAAYRCINGEMVWLGSYDTPELAHAAYLASLEPDRKAA